MSTVTRLRAEHLDNPLGIFLPTPRLSWRLPADASAQVAYELADGPGSSTGRIEGRDNVLVPWPFAPLTPGECREVQVRVWTDSGLSPWSPALPIEAGRFDPQAWVASWIGPAERVVPVAGARPAYLLRGHVVLPKPVLRARLSTSARGIYEASINGQRVSDEELAPGYTEYGHRTQVATHDVTSLLALGENVIGVVLADGWYRGQVGLLRAADQWGAHTAFLGQLIVDHPDGTTTVYGTGPQWQWAHSSITRADLIEGQAQDLRRVDQGWNVPGGETAAWAPVRAHDMDHSTLVGPVAPPVRPVEVVAPVSVTRLGPGRDVVDLGQNINGHVRLRALGPEGTHLTLTHGEALAPDGDVTVAHLQPNMPFLGAPLSAGQVDEVTSAARPGDVFDPRLTTHGFRYVRIEGSPTPIGVEDVSGVVVHTDLRETGRFACSSEDLNRLHSAAVWSLRDNACDIPTDCPTRERAGWTGDWQLYVPTATFLYDVAGFSAKWLRDIAVMQWPNGVIGNMAPMPPAERAGFLESVNGSAGWGDAIVLVPWELWLEYGDLALLEEMWPHMTAWLTFAEGAAAGGRHPDRVAVRPEPAHHEQWLWDSGFHWGEWLVPGEDIHDFAAFRARDKADVATAYLAHTAGVAARVATLLGLANEARRWQDLADHAREAWQAEFVDASGAIAPDTQANHVRALTFGLVPDSLRPRVADRLAALVRENGNRLGTGFLATPDLLPALADHGHLDTAYVLLFQRQEPSWLSMIDRGATTVWEWWNGIDDDGVPHESLNHYSKGAVISFLHRHVAGLRRTAPTWREFMVAPRPGGGLTWARAEHDSPHGLVSSAWRIDDDAFTLDVVVPPGCRAHIRLPSGATHDAGSGRHSWIEPA
ncbi:MAG: family 78 glycoside hydrolase catalytic domain [Phycicoccus sp.]|nr:family 78 glycoside hydrolase catalytic domain [Phycicoccus sp.]